MDLVVVPMIVDRPSATVNDARVDITTAIIKEKYTKIAFRIDD